MYQRSCYPILLSALFDAVKLYCMIPQLKISGCVYRHVNAAHAGLRSHAKLGKNSETNSQRTNVRLNDACKAATLVKDLYLASDL